MSRSEQTEESEVISAIPIVWRGTWKRFYPPLLSIVLALSIGAALLIISGRDPLKAYLGLFFGAFGTFDRFVETLVKATPLLIVALSVSISFRCQVWNIGAGGQFLLGAIAATWCALNLSWLPSWLLILLCPLAGIAGGALWGGIAGLLKGYLQANEVITTTMLNYIAIYLLAYLVRGPMMDPSGVIFPQSALLPDALQLTHLIPGTRLNITLIIALLCTVLVLLFWRSKYGLQTEIVGASRRVAEHSGLNVNRTFLLVTMISGGLAGLSGWGDVFALHYRLIEEIARGYGNLGIVVALLGELHPIGMIISAFLFAALVVGGNAMERNAGVPFALVDVIQGVVILLVLARSYLFQQRRRSL